MNALAAACPPTARPIAARRLAGLVVVLALAPSAMRTAAAQPAVSPLPAVIYPSVEPVTAPSEPEPLLLPPEPAGTTNDGAPVQYYLVDGIWGFRDRDRRFHRLPSMAGRDLAHDRRPPNAGVMRERPGPGRFGARLPETHAPFMPDSRSGLPNPPPGPIVVQSPAPRDRNRTR